MIVQIPESFTNSDRKAFETWLEQNRNNLPALVEINGCLYRAIGIYTEDGQLVSVNIAP